MLKSGIFNLAQDKTAHSIQNHLTHLHCPADRPTSLPPSPTHRPTRSHSLWRYHHSITPSHFQASNFWSIIPSQSTRHLEFPTCTSTPAYITCTQQWSRSPCSLSPTIPGTAQNSSVPSILPTWLSIDSHQCSRPPSFSTWLSPHAFVSDDGCSTTVGFGEELVSPLMPWLTYFWGF